MALDADTPRDRASRKTLDDIRQELEAEFGPVATPAAPARAAPAQTARAAPAQTASTDRLVDRLVPRRYLDEDETELEGRDELPVELERPARRRGYVIAGLVGCVVGQALLLGSLTATRFWPVPRASDVSAPLPGATGTGVPSPAPTPTPMPSSAASPVAEPTAAPVPSDNAAISESTVPAMPTPPPASAPAPPASAPVPPASAPAPLASAPAPPAPPAAPVDLPRRVVHQPAPALPAPAPARSRLSRSDDWVESQALLRAARRE